MSSSSPRTQLAGLALLPFVLAAPVRAADIDAGFDAHGFHPMAYDGQLRDPWGVLRPERFTRFSWHAGGLLEYASAPLTHVTGDPDDPREIPALDHLVALNTSLGFAPSPLVRLEASLPLFLGSQGEDDDPNGFLPGDLRMAATFAAPEIALLERLRIDLGLYPWIDLPTGDHTVFLGQRAVAGGFLAAIGLERDVWTFAGHLGFGFNPDLDLQNLVGTDTLLAGLAAGRVLNKRSAVHLETLLSLPLDRSDEWGTQIGAEAMVSYRRKVNDTLHLSAGASGGLSHGAGVAPFRVVFGGGFGRTTEPPPPDLDLDGVADAHDPCPEQPETPNGYHDEDGCPDFLGTVVVKPMFRDTLREDVHLKLAGPEGDLDFGPGERLLVDDVLPGTAWAAEATAGTCLSGVGSVTAVEGPIDLVVELDRGLEGKLSIRVANADGEPIEKASVRFLADDDPCGPYEPWLDLDDAGQGSISVGAGTHPMVFEAPYYAPHRQDVRIFNGGHERVLVSLEPARTKLEAGRIVIMDKVFFETGRAVIKRESWPLLEEVANLLLANPEVLRLEVGGHTDDQGADDTNLALSLARAQAVVDFLTGHGVELSRLVAKGYGETSPIASNKTTDGRAENRRVEFNILARATPQVPDGAPGSTEPAPTPPQGG